MRHRAFAAICRACVLPALPLCGAGPAGAQGLDRSVVARRIDTPPVLDGVLDDAAWAGIAPITEFVQHDPVEGAAPSEPTEVYVAYDADNLYVGAQLHDSRPGEMVRNVMARQARLFGEDRLHLMIDTFRDRRNGYYFEVNPNGLRADALLANNSAILQDWDGIWQAEARVHDAGWTVEIRIPLKTLSFDPALDTWGLNFYRSIAGRREFLSWNTATRQDFPYAPAFFGELRGLSGLERGAGLDLVPSLTLRQSRRYAQAGGAGAQPVARADDFEWEPSLDALYKLTDATTAALTLNTDFAATEVDERQVNLTRFSLFFPEKRLFFLQDAGIFEFGGLSGNGRPFFSRTIGLGPDGMPIDLQGGLKVTGREGPVSFGFLGVRQDESGALSARDLYVGRAQLNVLGESSVGLIATHGDPRSARANRLAGGDFRLRRSDLWGGQVLEATGWLQKSDTQGLRGDDAAFGGALRLPNDRWFVEVFASEIQANFEPALGFVNRRGIRDVSGFFQFRSRPADSYWLAHNHWLFLQHVEGIGGGVQSQELEVMPWGPYSRDADFYRPLWEHQREVLTEGFLLFDRLAIPAGDYAFDRWSLRLESAESRALRLYATLGTGTFFDGRRDEVSVDATWRASRRVTVDLDFAWNDVRLPSGRFISRLYGVRTSLAITPRLALIALGQFDNVSEDVGMDLRLQWLPQAGQEVSVVCNHGAARELEGNFESQRAEAIAKVSWTFRF